MNREKELLFHCLHDYHVVYPSANCNQIFVKAQQQEAEHTYGTCTSTKNLVSRYKTNSHCHRQQNLVQQKGPPRHPFQTYWYQQ